jgi:hypothetical protein
MRLVPLLTGLAVLLAAQAARAEEPSDKGKLSTVLSPVYDDAPPAMRYPPPLTRVKVIAVGLALAGSAWGVSFACATNWNLVPGARELKIPVVGPWIALGKSGCASDDPECADALIGVRGALYVVDGLVQLAGTALIVQGIIMKTEPLKKASFLGLRVGGVEMQALPVATPAMRGLGLVGTF